MVGGGVVSAIMKGVAGEASVELRKLRFPPKIGQVYKVDRCGIM